MASWLEENLGIDTDTLGDILTGVGTAIDLWDQWERKEVNEEVAQFTRQRQILDITAFIGEQTRLREINNARMEWMDTSQRAVIEGQRDYANAERSYWRTRGAAELAMGRSRAADDALMRGRQFDTQAAQLNVRGAQIAAQRMTLGHERGANELRQAQNLAQQEALADQRNLLNVETAERGRILAARQQSVSAGMQTVQAKQAQVAGVLRSRVGARTEEAVMAGGAVAAGAAARGLTGSFEGTAMAQIGRQAGRDIMELGLGAASEMAGLQERQAGLMLEGQRIRSEAALGAARDAVGRSRLAAEGMGLRARGEELQAEQMALGGREGVLRAQEGLIETERLAIESGRQVSDRQYERDLLQADLTAAQSGLREGAAALDATRAEADLADLTIDISQIGSEITSGDTAIAIADWTLQQAPELPDSDMFFLRSAIGTMFQTGQQAW